MRRLEVTVSPQRQILMLFVSTPCCCCLLLKDGRGLLKK